MRWFDNIVICCFIVLFLGCAGTKKESTDGDAKTDVYKVELEPPAGRAMAAFAEGCFWCSEHIFEAVVGVDSAVSGYAGGMTPNPTYELVNTETTGHAETVLVYYDPSVIDYEELTRVFFTSHDPTTPDQQGPDRGNSYRSILFYSTPSELDIAVKIKEEYNESGMFADPIVTEIKPLDAFYRAEQYHQDYIEHNPYSPYVMGVSIPRFEKFKRNYKGKLK
ncbi:MAG TPA: peptide-methionine (S)-S-oxide reductase MsrA [Cyclobacteriaceae bacterium]|nr:peptide-methionine (S)-S-oxide reductase MsrA [Cyclobacteriaceae bacterium]HRW99370.1 peptide-methionine (S)-S-oxide reductase MsrA [Cyclobacteriaceae bacterium]